KVDELAYVMAVLARAIASMDPKSNDIDKKSDPDNELVTAQSICSKYGVTMYLTDGNKITYKNAQTCNNDVKYVIDKEDNDLQQDLVGLQSLMSKRDSQFSMAAKTVRKASNAASSAVRNL
ncbi:MAG: hypothetical protein J5614_06565, partial [Paludibacteraceae bacterium]|nr:hypothetical protein [Paludibacteraceae bacterium]